MFFSAKPGNCRFEIDRIVRDSSKQKKEQQSTLLFRYGDRLIVIVTFDDRSSAVFEEEFQNLLEFHHLNISDLCCGRSAVGKTVEQLDFLLKEAVYANVGTAILNKDFLGFDELGTFRFLMPYQDLTRLQTTIPPTSSKVEG